MEISTKFNKKCIKELFKNSFLISIFGLAAGIICFATYITFSIINNNWTDLWSIILIIAGVFVISISLVLFLKIIKLEKVAEESNGTFKETFLDDRLKVETFRGDTKVDEKEITYASLIHFSSTSNYVFLKLENKSVLPVSKTEELINFLLSKNIKRK